MDNARRAVACCRPGEFVRRDRGPVECGLPARRLCDTETLRRLLRKVIPGTHEIRGHTFLGRVFGQPLLDPELWHLSRNSVAWAVSIGLFTAWVPVPFQMVLAAGAAILVRCNLPVSVAMVWVSNPVTVAPLFVAAHKLGEWMLDQSPGDLRIELSLRWLFDELGNVWEPLLLGCFVLGLASAILGQIMIRLVWRAHIMVSWRDRRIRRQRHSDHAGAVAPAPAPAPSTVEVPGERGRKL